MKKVQAPHSTKRSWHGTPHLYPIVQRRNGGKEKLSSSEKEFLDTFLDSLSKMPSQYYRANTSKPCLELCFRSKSEVYAFYNESFVKEKQKPLSVRLFDDTFHQKNILIFSPKKDCCDTSVAHEKANICRQIMEKTLNTLKNRARDVKNTDKTTTRDVTGVYLHDINKIFTASEEQCWNDVLPE